VHGRSVYQFLPHDSASLQFQVLIRMQMDAYLKKEQINTLFVWVGALEGGGGLGGGSGGSSLKIGRAFLQNFPLPPGVLKIVVFVLVGTIAPQLALWGTKTPRRRHKFCHPSLFTEK